MRAPDRAAERVVEPNGIFEVAHRLALELRAEAHHAGEQLRVAVTGAEAGFLCFSAQTVDVLVSAGEHRVDRRPQRRVPLERRQAELTGEPRMPRGLLMPGGHVAEL